MWPFWSRDPAKDFPYEIGNALNSFHEYTFWYLLEGKKKATGEPVTILRYSGKTGDDATLEKAKAFIKRLKSFRHPAIVTYIDSLEAGDVILVVIEPCDPLPEYLASIKDEPQAKRYSAISYGLHQIAVGLKFLHDCNIIHNNMFIGSVLVNKSGVWRIGGFEYVISSYNDPMPTRYISSNIKYLPPELLEPKTRNNLNIWSADSFGLGCLIWETFNGPMSDSTSLSSLQQIPKEMENAYRELINLDPDKRISPMQFVDKTRNRFFKNSFLDAMLFLDQIQIKEESEKNRFFAQLTDQLDTFPKDLCKYKILPQLITAFEFSNNGSNLLGPLLKIGKLLKEEEFQKHLVPCLIKLFACKDRATRGKLLQEIEMFINYLQPNVVNEIFPQIVQGFLDSNSTIREQTVKCMLYLAPKLNYSNLNEEVLKHFARLQTRDEDCGIRSNTTVCLGRIACYLHPQTRQNVLIQAFLRSLRDPFHHARIAGILSLSATQNFYSLRDTATKVMPALCHMTMDPEKSVRDQAFKALKKFITKVEKVSEEPSLIEKMEGDLNAPGSSVSSTFASSWATWAVSALTSKFTRAKSSSNQTASAVKSSEQKVANEEQVKKLSSDMSCKNLTPEVSPEDNDNMWGILEEEVATEEDDTNAEDNTNLENKLKLEDELNLEDKTSTESKSGNNSSSKYLDGWQKEEDWGETSSFENTAVHSRLTSQKGKETTRLVLSKANTGPIISSAANHNQQEDDLIKIFTSSGDGGRKKQTALSSHESAVRGAAREVKDVKKKPKKGALRLGAQKIT